MAHSRSFLANQKARNAIVGAENLLKELIALLTNVSIFSFSNRFTENRSLLKLVCSPGKTKICLIFWKIVEKGVIFKERGFPPFYYYAMV